VSNRYARINEEELSTEERFGLAYCRLNSWEWDEIAGPKPEGFDELPDYDQRKFKWLRKKIKTKGDLIDPVLEAIEEFIGEANTSRYWWEFELGKSTEEWFEWYAKRRLKRRTI